MKDNLNHELITAISYFLDTYSRNEKSYGLVPDIYPMTHPSASIAGTGYLFVALVLGIKYNLISEEHARIEANKILDSLAKLETQYGFYYHFYDYHTGEKCEWIEISNIDTAIMFSGMLTAGSYFQGEILEKALAIFNKANHRFFLTKYQTMLSMAIDRSGQLIGHWDVYAEQLMLYILGAASQNPQYRLGKEIYYNFKRPKAKYKDIEFINSWYGSLFTFQYSHAFIDFKNKKDELGTDWFNNSVLASKAAWQYAKDSEGKYQSFHSKSWGLTACMAKQGYIGHFGNPPTGLGQDFNDGTIAPCGAIGSIVFTPKESIDALNYYYSIPNLIGKYGLYDSYNQDQNYYSNCYLAIDKGIEMVMIENYLHQTIWKLFNDLPIIKDAFTRLGIKED